MLCYNGKEKSEKMKNTLKKKRYLCILLCALLIIVLSVAGYIWFSMPRIHFTQNPITLEVKETYSAKAFIKKIDHGSLQDVHVETNIDTTKLGNHQITYTIDGHTFTLDYIVKDSKPPVVVAQDQKISIGDKVAPEDFIQKIDDATKTTARFAKAYSFTKLGKQTVQIIVEDEGKNQTTVKAVANILKKDTQPPVFTGILDMTIQKGEKPDFKKGVEAIDDRDGKINFTINKNNFDAKQPGRYSITYQAIDKAGNKTEINRTVIVQEKTSGKIIYLTIDDGPSANTPKVLEILDRYHVKATFFVTAQCPSYLGYIKTAYQKAHAIGLHTYSHDYGALYASESAYFKDLQNISDVVKQQTGLTPNIIRFPGGSSNTVSSNVPGLMTRLAKAVQERGYQYYDWNSSSGDGNSALPSASLIQEATSYGGASPLMMLTHDHPGSQASVEALPAIIEYYQSLGYTFKTVDSSVSGFHHGINN